ncbi:hypothetical protein EW146_g7347 [Bondarzewia mesenterica]|uniref:ribonuclease H n=1 Tax=Bondarzewia mesenterica TaxID=1095465 RepID=A0A4S4LL65_9AGAM|nr:hypothetical protein EW146_g7347 [Bondarzewia mesenterica]
MPAHPYRPIELPDGSLRCQNHHLEACTECGVDYSFMRDILRHGRAASHSDFTTSDSSSAVGDPSESETANEDEDLGFGSDGERPVGEYCGIVTVPPTSHVPRKDMPVEQSQRPSRWTFGRRGAIQNPVRRFTPPNSSDIPTALFVPQVWYQHKPRFVRRSNYQEILIYTDGACLSNGGADPRAGCSFIFHPCAPNANVGFRLELKGPDNQVHPQTSNRAELRAAIAALQFRAWDGEGFTRIVIATDSEYTVLGVTERVWNWEKNGWLTAKGTPVQNRDLWEALRDEVFKWETRGVRVMFWLIPREQNLAADTLAKEAAAKLEVNSHYSPIYGVMV